MTALQHGRYIEIYYLPGTTNQKDSEQMSPPLTSDLGVEENLEMSLNTFSGYDLGIVDFAQIGATAERARTTSCLTSRSPGPAKPRDAKLPERLEAAVRGGADNFTTSETTENVTEVIAVQAKGILWEGCWVPWKTLGRQRRYRDPSPVSSRSQQSASSSNEGD